MSGEVNCTWCGRDLALMCRACDLAPCDGGCDAAEDARREGAAIAFGVIALGEWARRTAAASFAYRREWSVLPGAEGEP